MKESIHIKNLGPIRDIFIAELKPITVLIGESGSGKSTLMKAIALFRWLFKMHNIRSYLKHSGVAKAPFRFQMETYLSNCGFDEFISEQTEISYTFESEMGNRYQIAFKNNRLSGTSDKFLIKSDDLHFLKLSFISEYRNIIPLWAERGASLSGAYMGAGSYHGAGGQLGFYFSEVYGDFDIASDNLKELELKYLDLHFAVKKFQGRKRFRILSKSENYEISLKNSSSGTQNAIPITLIAEHFAKHFRYEDAFNRSVLSYLTNTDKLTDFKPVTNLGDMKKKLFIHIEEPELSLFPEAQCELIGDLISKCFVTNKNSIELIFSTHSPYIVNYLNLLIKAADQGKQVDGANIRFEDLVVYQIEDGEIEKLNLTNQRIIDTNPLSDTINDIYDRFARL